MFFRKMTVFTMVLGFICQALTATQATASELPQELKEKSIKLLRDVAAESRQLKLPENRITAQTIAMELLWAHSESEARVISQLAFTELKQLFTAIKETDVDGLTTKETNEHYYKRQRLADLRREYLLTLAGRDPQAALTALEHLTAKKIEGYDPLEATKLKLEIGSAMIKKEPDKTYSLAKEQITRKVTFEFIESLKELHRRDPALAARIGRDIYAIIRTAKISPPSESVGADRPAPDPGKSPAAARTKPEIEFQVAAFFVNTAWELNRRAARDKDKKTPPLLTDAEMKEMVDVLAVAYLAAKNPARYSISQVITEITKFSPAQAERIRLKVGPETARTLDSVVESTLSYIAREDKNADELTKTADRAAPEKRDELYVEAIRKALLDDDPEKAQAIATRISDRRSYAYVFEAIESAIPIATARRGDMTAVRKMLDQLKTSHERVAALTELAAALSSKGDKETAHELIKQSLEMLLAVKFDQNGLKLLSRIVSVYASIAPEQAFTLAELSIEQMNPFIDAGIRFDEFYDQGAIESGEIRYEAMGRLVMQHVPNSIDLLRRLAHADLERTVGLTHKFIHPEIGIFTRLRIAQALLDASAAEKEKKASEQIQSENEYH